MALTPARHRNAVSEGTALGLLLCGRDSLPDDKTRVDLAFAGAWRSWEHGHRFSQVQTDMRNGKAGSLVIAHAVQTRDAWVLYWERKNGQLAIVARQPDWDPACDEDLEFAVSTIDGDVPKEGWVSLAAALRQRLDR